MGGRERLGPGFIAVAAMEGCARSFRSNKTTRRAFRAPLETSMQRISAKPFTPKLNGDCFRLSIQFTHEAIDLAQPGGPVGITLLARTAKFHRDGTTHKPQAAKNQLFLFRGQAEGLRVRHGQTLQCELPWRVPGRRRLSSEIIAQGGECFLWVNVPRSLSPAGIPPCIPTRRQPIEK